MAKGAKTGGSKGGVVDTRSEAPAEWIKGDLVWARVAGHPWWPGQVMDPAKALGAFRPLDAFSTCHPWPMAAALCKTEIGGRVR
jgi:PWWP domain